MGTSVLARLALELDRREDVLRTLARALPSLDLRLARLLAWLRSQDLAPLGFAGWQAFLMEKVDWGESWVRDMLRLVRSNLMPVIRAACEGRVPLSLAVQASGWCHPEDAEAWVDAAVAGTLPPRPKGRPRGASSTVEPREAEVLDIFRAREKARLLTGLRLSEREADARILAWWRDGRGDLVEEALAPAPKPDTGEAQLDWPFEDPATLLLGPWRTPRTLAEALATLEELQSARRGRVLQLARLAEEVIREGRYVSWGYSTVERFCVEALGLSVRTLQRYRELGRALRRRPSLSALPVTKAEIVGRVTSDPDVERWVGVAQRTGVGELRRAAAHVEAGADPAVVLAAYEEAMAGATGTVALEGLQAPVPPPLTDRVHPDLPAAARWLLEVEVPRQRGFGKVKERDRLVCRNPECRRRALRNHAHHLHPRAEGGSNDPANGICVCPSCHLRLIHPGHVGVELRGVALVWTYPGGRTATVFPGPDGIGLAG